MRRAITILLIIAAIGGASWFAYGQWGNARAAQAPNYEAVPLTRGNITATVSATGNVLPERDASLSFPGAGTITQVKVKQGDPVKAGQVLAQLDTRDLDLAVRQAEASVRTAEAQLQQLQERPNQVDVAAAQAQLASTQANYQQVLNGSDADELAAARAQVEQAKASLDQAQQAYDQVKDRPDVAMLPQALQLQQATINYETAQAQYRVTSRGAKESQVAAAQAQVAQAQAALDKLQRGPSQAQVDVAKAGVEQARLSLEQAQQRLENARLVAPWDGIVTAVNIVEGTGTAPQQTLPAIRLADTGQYHINVSVDEADIASIAEGQPVSIELDAFPNQNLTGHVAKIAPASGSAGTAGGGGATGSSAAGGVVTYQVRIDIDPASVHLLSGMSATATITSNTRENVLVVPNRAIQVDRESGKTFVERLNRELPEKVEIRLGLRGEQVSEVRQGLADGDQIVIRQVSSSDRLRQAVSGGQ